MGTIGTKVGQMGDSGFEWYYYEYVSCISMSLSTSMFIFQARVVKSEVTSKCDDKYQKKCSENFSLWCYLGLAIEITSCSCLDSCGIFDGD